NVNLMMKVTLGKILPRLFFKAVRRGAIFKRKHLVFLLQFIGSLIRNEFKAPDFSHRYPAILHINLDKDHRNGGLGSRLMEAYLGYLHNQKIPGVHLSSISEHGSRFFVKSGFELLYKRPRTYYKHILKADLNCYCYGKKIGE
ncbi:MAG: GNAT family N-acetyltransferase, partial [Candidatus Omnitrophota bacterium]